MIDNNFIHIGWIDTELCDKIVLDYENKKDKQIQAHSARGYRYVPSVDMDVDLITEYEYEINKVLKQYIELYSYSKEGICSFEIDFPYNFQKYSPGHYYSVWHCENNGNPANRKRHLVFMTYLNDVTDGGETEFLYQNLKIKPEKGKTIIWPAYFTHTHRGIPSNSQEKYISTGWFTFFDTDNFLENSFELSDEDFFGKLDRLNNQVN